MTPTEDANAMTGCHDCGRPYGDEHGFPDLVVPHAIWNTKLSPKGNEGGLLCPSCMCQRAHDAGVRCSAAFVSGPFCVEDSTETEVNLRNRLATLEATVATLAAMVDVLVEALKAADQFITNGIELGYIRMPEADCPDTAHETPGKIRAAIALAKDPTP